MSARVALLALVDTVQLGRRRRRISRRYEIPFVDVLELHRRALNVLLDDAIRADASRRARGGV